MSYKMLYAVLKSPANLRWFTKEVKIPLGLVPISCTANWCHTKGQNLSPPLTTDMRPSARNVATLTRWHSQWNNCQKQKTCQSSRHLQLRHGDSPLRIKRFNYFKSPTENRNQRKTGMKTPSVVFGFTLRLHATPSSSPLLSPRSVPPSRCPSGEGVQHSYSMSKVNSKSMILVFQKCLRKKINYFSTLRRVGKEVWRLLMASQ